MNKCLLSLVLDFALQFGAQAIADPLEHSSNSRSRPTAQTDPIEHVPLLETANEIWQDKLHQWQQQRQQNLKSPDGWLTRGTTNIGSTSEG